jgi:RNA polymerase-binding protein DksA
MAKSGKTPKGSTAKGTTRKKAKKTTAEKLTKSPFAKKDLQHFRQLLLDRRNRILKNVTAMEQEALKAAGQDFSVDHMADHGSDNFEQDLTLSLVESERKELYEIDRALLRIEGTTFGICEGTGHAINRERLEAIPYTRYSIDFQRKLEAGEVDFDKDEEDEEG